MKNKNIFVNILNDLSFIILLILIFVCTSFIALNSESISLNIFILCIAFISMIVTYFTSITVGLIIDSICILILICTAFYFSIAEGIEVPEYVFFWAIMIPTLTVNVVMLTHSNLNLQSEILNLQKKVDKLVTIDEISGLKNQTVFLHDTQVYMSIALRYNMELVLTAVELKHKYDIERIIGSENTQKLISKLSNILNQHIRNEDLLYMVDSKSSTWAILMITNDSSNIKSVIERIKEEISKMDFEDISKFNRLNIEIQTGFAVYSKEISTPFEFWTIAKKEMEYDI